MSTTTLRIEDDLKARVAAAVEQTGKTPHAFMLEAITRTIDQAEQDRAFYHLAEQRWATLLETGQSVGWEDTKSWLSAKANRASPAALKPRRIDL